MNITNFTAIYERL